VGWFVPVAPDAAPARLPAASSVAESFPAGAAGGVAAPPGEASAAGTQGGAHPAVTSTPAPSAGAAAAPKVSATAREARPSFAGRTLHQVLPNGIVLDVLESRAVPSFAVEGILLAGDAAAPPQQPALAELTARMVRRGTTRRSKLEIAELLEGAGLRLALRNDGTEVAISASGLARDLPTLLEVLAEELATPALSPEELAKAKAEMRNDVLRQAENTGARAVARLNRLSLPEGHPYRGAEPEERLASLDALGREDLVAFHQERYVGSALILAIVGDVDAQAVARQVERMFGGLERGEAPAIARASSSPDLAAEGAAGAAAADAQRAVVSMPGKANMNLVLGHASGLSRADPDYEAALLANAAFGQSGMSSRLGMRVRDREGLSYSVASRFVQSDLADGVWLVNVNLAPPNLEQALRSTRDELARYVREGMTAEELRVNQSFFAGNFQVRLGSNAGIASALATAAKFGFGPAHLDEFPDRIRRVTLAQANAALRRRIRPESLHVVVAGDLERFPPSLDDVLPSRVAPVAAAPVPAPVAAPPAGAAAGGAFEHFFGRRDAKAPAGAPSGAGAAAPAPAPPGAPASDDGAAPSASSTAAPAEAEAAVPCPPADEPSAFDHFFAKRKPGADTKEEPKGDGEAAAPCPPAEPAEPPPP
jgi:zinc protease